MAVQYIPKNHTAEHTPPPLRRSTRHLGTKHTRPDIWNPLLTPEPTPRAIRAQKRRKLVDDTTSPHPQPVSPEPFSPTHSPSPYIIKSKSKSRSRKRKALLIEDDAASSTTSSGTDSPSRDPLPRSLTKRRKIDRSSPAPSKSKSKSNLPPTPSKKLTNLTPRSSKHLPRAGNKSNVRRSARLVVHTTSESEKSNDPTVSSADDDDDDDSEMEMVACIGESTSEWKSIIPSHISNPVLKGRPPPNPALYAQLQLASYRRTKPNTPSPLSLYSYTGLTPPTSPALSATAGINSLDAIDDIPSLGEVAAVEAITAIAEGENTLVGLPMPVTEQLFHEQQHQQFYGHEVQMFEQPVCQSSVPSLESSNSPPPLADMGLMMMDLQFQMQLQHMASPGGMHFGVDQMGFIMGAENSTEERNEGQAIPTVHMQDVHLHSHHHEDQNNENQNHQLYRYPYFSTEQQGQIQEYGAQEGIAYGGESHGQLEYQHHQEHQQAQQPSFQPQYQPEYPHHEQPQVQSSPGYGGIQPYEGGAPMYDQQDFQAQQQQQLGGDALTPENRNVGYDAGAYPSLKATTTPVPVSTAAVASVSIPTTTTTTTTPNSMAHYTLSMHHALVYFQQSLSRFREDQILLTQDATEMHMRQLEEFQREKEERKRKLKRTKLVRDVQVVPMGSVSVGGTTGFGMGVGAVGRARGLWAVACKARMFEVVRIYTRALIREVTESCAREYFSRTGLKYPSCWVVQQARIRRRTRMREDDMSVLGDDGLVDCDHEQEGEDGSCLVEKRDEDDEEFMKEKIFDFELLDDDDEYLDDVEEMEGITKQVEEDEDDEMDDEEDDEDEEDVDEEEDLESDDMDVMTDPLFQPELSMRITSQEAMSTTAGGVETTFYVPPPEVYTFAEPNVEDESQVPESKTDSTTTTKEQKRKLMVFQRPVLPLPPPALSTFRPAALKFYNVDPVHAGRGTPCVKERREMWAGGSLDLRHDTYSSGLGACHEVETGDSVFGDCLGTCCGKEKERKEEKEGSSSSLPQAQPLNVEIPPDRIPHRRRGVMGRTELLKVYAPPTRSVPSHLPLARRPPRPPPPPPLTPLQPPPSPQLGLDESASSSDSVVTVQQQQQQAFYHHHQYPPVVPYSWEQVADAVDVLAYQGIDASVWLDGHAQHPTPVVAAAAAALTTSSLSLSSTGISASDVQVQPTFNPSSSELSAALG